MAHTLHESLKPSCHLKDLLHPEKLLEHFWFFSNILVDTKTYPIMSKNINTSDSSTSSNTIMSGKSAEETYESIQKRSGGQDESWPSNLIRASSLSPCMERKDRKPATKGIDDHGRKLSSNVKNEECHDEESEFSMGKLIRQASLSNSESFPPRRRAANKGLTSSSLSRHGSITNMELAKLKGIRPQRPTKPLKSQKSLNDLVLYQELQGIKELGLDSEPCQSVDQADRPDGKKSTEDIKAQIKFWARAVASNVRQES